MAKELGPRSGHSGPEKRNVQQICSPMTTPRAATATDVLTPSYQAYTPAQHSNRLSVPLTVKMCGNEPYWNELTTFLLGKKSIQMRHSPSG